WSPGAFAMAVRWRSRQHLLELGRGHRPSRSPGVAWTVKAPAAVIDPATDLVAGNAGSVVRRRAGARGTAVGVGDMARLRVLARSRARLDGIARPMPLASSTSSAGALEDAADGGLPAAPEPVEDVR